MIIEFIYNERGLIIKSIVKITLRKKNRTKNLKPNRDYFIYFRFTDLKKKIKEIS